MIRPEINVSSTAKLENALRQRGRGAAIIAGVVGLAIACAGCQKKVAVPNVVQQDLDQAKQALTTAQLKLGNIGGVQGSIPPGSYVTAQSPQPGTEVAADSTVDLTIEAPTTVPDLTNSKLTDAVNSLQVLGLHVAFVRQPTLKLFGGSKVIAISPPPNTSVRKGSMVTLTVSSPPDLGALVGLVTKEPAYEKLDPEYKQVLDAFLAPSSRDATSGTAGPASAATGTQSPASGAKGPAPKEPAAAK